MGIRTKDEEIDRSQQRYTQTNTEYSFDVGPVNLKQVKTLIQAIGERYSYDGKRGAANFIDNRVNMFKTQKK